MEMQIRHKDRCIVIEVSGAVNMVYSPQLREAIHRAFPEKVHGVIVDLHGVGYMDSSGLATLVEGVQLAQQENKKFALARVESEMVQHLFEISHLDGLFEQFSTIEEAKESMMRKKTKLTNR
ncbi:MAG: anti-sigma factor antagonist [Candidatus Omnitrophota bacterium]|jgi:anti-sigma B factor antagonist|nr:MAG: anti-sigma factor antagonist [Candidatus Omnitrophota bacterium]